MTVSHAHARNACAHEQSTNIESGAVQWHKQSEQLLDCLCECERECEREKVNDFFAQNRPFATSKKPIQGALINGLCDFEDGIGAARRRPYRASDLT